MSENYGSGVTASGGRVGNDAGKPHVGTVSPNRPSEGNWMHVSSPSPVSASNDTQAPPMPITRAYEPDSKTGKPQIVKLKNYPMRNRAVSILSLPFLLLVSAILAIPVVFLSGGSFGIAEALALTIVGELLVVFLALVYVGELKNWRDKLRLKNFKWVNMFGGLGIVALLFILLQGLAIGLDYIGLPIESSDTSSAITSATGWTGVLIAAVMVPFIVPFVEEVFFRGYVLGFFQDSFSEDKKKAGAILALIVSSIIFSLAHFQGLQTSTDIFLLVWIFFMAVINGFLFLKTQSIWTPFALHLAYNGLTILVASLI